MFSERFPRALFLLSSMFIFAACGAPPRAGSGRAPSADRKAEAPKAAPTPEADVLVDEPRLAKPYAVIGGTVRNVGVQRLEQLSVVLELRRRDDNTTERREAAVEPAGLGSGEQGKFSIKVAPDEFRGSSVVGLRSGAGAREVAFRTMPGAKRPPERIPDRVITVQTPRPRPKGGDSEFINTPDTPIKVP